MRLATRLTFHHVCAFHPIISEAHSYKRSSNMTNLETRSVVISSMSGTNIKAHFQQLLDNTWIPIWTRDRKRNGGVMPLVGPYR